jgi:arylformamidase
MSDLQMIDLTETLHHGMAVYPGDPDVSIVPIHHYDREGWLLRYIQMGSHTGTHVDAFSHMDKDGASLDDMPLSRFLGMAQVAQIDQALPQSMGLIFREGDLTEEHLPLILASGAPFIGVGDDATMTVELERTLLKNQLVTFTRLVNCGQLPTDKSFFFIGLPLKIAEGDGSPVRAVALVG